MDEKTMINDLILNLKSNISLYQTAICDSENIGIRQILQQMRNSNESMLYELTKVANLKGYTKQVAKNEIKEIEKLKKEKKEDKKRENKKKKEKKRENRNIIVKNGKYKKLLKT